MVNTQEVINNAVADGIIIAADEYENRRLISMITTAFEQVRSARDHICLGELYQAAEILEATEMQLISIRKACEKD